MPITVGQQVCQTTTGKCAGIQFQVTLAHRIYISSRRDIYYEKCLGIRLLSHYVKFGLIDQNMGSFD